MKKPVLLAVLSTTVLTAFAYGRAPMAPFVVYGEDGRQEVHEATLMNQKLAKSTATMIGGTKMTRSDDKKGVVQINQKTLREWMASRSPMAKQLFSAEVNAAADAGMGFCETERFIDQPNAGMCSGFLIAPDLLVTAGHCVTSYNFCKTYSWVFDFEVDKTTGKAGVDVPEDNVYGCKKVVSNTLNNFLGLDYAVIQLDRVVKGRQPLDIRQEGMIDLKTPLTVIGSPSGLPLKVTTGGAVRKNTHPNFFVGNLDTYQGNSGSAVFNADTGVIEGILVRGENDFVPNADKSCIQTNVCTDEGCRGEDVSRIHSIPEIAVMKALTDAAVAGDKEKLDTILKNKLWVDIYGKDRTSPMMKAAAAGRAVSVEALIAKGADVTLTDLEGNTALHLLAKSLNASNAETLEKLIAGKSALEAKNTKGQTASLVAASALNLEGVKLLIKSGVDKNAVDAKGDSVLFPFATQFDVASVLELTDSGVDASLVNASGISALAVRNSLGDTLLLSEIKKKNLDNALRLHALGTDINAQNSLGDTATLVASKYLDLSTVKTLFAAGADKNARDLQGETVLFSFAKMGDFTSVLSLTDAGVDAKIADVNGVSVLDIILANGDTLLLTAAKKSTVEDVLRLVRLGANINAKDASGETAIYTVLRSKSVEGLKAMINAGARVDIENKARISPMELVKKIGFKDAKKIIRGARKAEKRINVAQE